MSSGTCGCQGYDLTQGDDYQTVMGMLSYVEFYIGGYSEDIQRQVVALICNGVTNFGEHSQVISLGWWSYQMYSYAQQTLRGLTESGKCPKNVLFATWRAEN